MKSLTTKAPRTPRDTKETDIQNALLFLVSLCALGVLVVKFFPAFMPQRVPAGLGRRKTEGNLISIHKYYSNDVDMCHWGALN